MFHFQLMNIVVCQSLEYKWAERADETVSVEFGKNNWSIKVYDLKYWIAKPYYSLVKLSEWMKLI